jgi:hypothetical protein
MGAARKKDSKNRRWGWSQARVAQHFYITDGGDCGFLGLDQAAQSSVLRQSRIDDDVAVK